MFSRTYLFGVFCLVTVLVAAAVSPASAAGLSTHLLVAAAAGADEHHDDAHADDHGHHIGAAGVAEDPAEIRGDLAIFTFVVFVLLLAVLWKFAWGPIVAALDQRERRIADNIAAAEKAQADAKVLLEQYEQRLAGAQDEVRAILDEARRDAEHTQKQMLEKAAADAEAVMARAKREIDTAKDQALKELGEQAARLSVELASRIIRAELNGDSHARLIEEALAKFPQGSPSVN